MQRFVPSLVLGHRRDLRNITVLLIVLDLASAPIESMLLLTLQGTYSALFKSAHNRHLFTTNKVIPAKPLYSPYTYNHQR